jgi:hypothetical protein
VDARDAAVLSIIGTLVGTLLGSDGEPEGVAAAEAEFESAMHAYRNACRTDLVGDEP